MNSIKEIKTIALAHGIINDIRKGRNHNEVFASSERIDVDYWRYFSDKGIYAKDIANYQVGENEFGVLKKLKNNKISIYDSYNKNICNICGNKVDYIFMNYCPCCKNQLKIECKVCNKQTISVLDFCMNCGNNIKE